ncbi:hypothetical protein FSP39_022560 [Pinctada imbricata]|uniref:Methylosome protein 50 n=1 Tax=Pinctada imbricata TaxID=66713 RepID=A0AA88Y584_PINIB|nr:hypothetical protein FSP39_022560 [Pinctada imbricata]
MFTVIRPPYFRFLNPSMPNISPSVIKVKVYDNMNIDGGVLLGASSLTGRYWFGSLWYCKNPEDILCLEKCTAGVQLEAGLGDAVWLDDSKVLVGLDTGGVAVWELTDEYRTFVHVQSAVEHDDMVSSVSVATDKNRAVSGSYDKCIKVWDMETMSSVTTYRGHYDMVQAVKYHPTEPALILSCSQDGRTCLWDTRDQKQVTVLGGFVRNPYPLVCLDTSPLQHSPTYVTWNPSSQYNYTVSDESGQIVIKDTRATQDTCITFCPHKRSVTKLEYNPDR